MKNIPIDPDFLDKENIISKLSLLQTLERMWPYQSPCIGTASLFDRIDHSLGFIPKEMRSYALALYANTIYLPPVFLSLLWKHLFEKAKSQLLKKNICDSQVLNNLAELSFFLEVDPSGLLNPFFHENGIEGRLDSDRYPRIQTVKDFALQCMAGNDEATKWLDREFWVILTDSVLSGTSLGSDLERMIDLARKTSSSPIIIVLAQVMTDVSELALKEVIQKASDLTIVYNYGFILGSSFQINGLENSKCSLFNHPDTYKGVTDLCNWLSEQKWYISSPSLKDAKDKSGDDMRFGFKRCGLTLVTAHNAPTATLPLLWFNEGDDSFKGPFPRNMSRLGASNEQG